jgi:hypothetical protein
LRAPPSSLRCGRRALLDLADVDYSNALEDITAPGLVVFREVPDDAFSGSVMIVLGTTAGTDRELLDAAEVDLVISCEGSGLSGNAQRHSSPVRLRVTLDCSLLQGVAPPDGAPLAAKTGFAAIARPAAWIINKAKGLNQ